MISAWELTNVTARLVLPPTVLILLAFVGLSLVKVSPRFGRWMAMVSLFALLALSLPIVSNNLVRSLESPFADPALDRRGGAIVVLGGGTYERAPEYGQDTASRETLERVRYAAHLAKRTKKPVLVSSGNPGGAATSEGVQMQAALRELGVSVAWVEGGSDNTLENARLSYRILEKSGIKTIYLITHAWHMPRARLAFERSGFTVIPAGTAYVPRRKLSVLDFTPSANSLAGSWIFFHEIAGLAWYHLKFALGK